MEYIHKQILFLNTANLYTILLDDIVQQCCPIQIFFMELKSYLLHIVKGLNFKCHDLLLLKKCCRKSVILGRVLPQNRFIRLKRPWICELWLSSWFKSALVGFVHQKLLKLLHLCYHFRFILFVVNYCFCIIFLFKSKIFVFAI